MCKQPLDWARTVKRDDHCTIGMVHEQRRVRQVITRDVDGVNEPEEARENLDPQYAKRTIGVRCLGTAVYG